MRPLPRLHAITDARVRALDDFGVRAAAIAAAGSAVCIHARDRTAGGDALTRLADRIAALVRPAEAQLAVNARPDVAAACGAQGVQLGLADLSVADARGVAPHCWIGVSVHDEDAGRAAAGAGADLLVAGTIFASASHPDRPGAGLALIERLARLGVPVIAIGGMTPERARLAREAGAWGVAAIGALWDAPDPAAAALAMLEPWMEV
jgi:thiamine-phosphate pyrophosphorylase